LIKKAPRKAALFVGGIIMQKVTLGNTGIEVTRLCFGALTVGPVQVNMSPEDGGDVIAHALKNGVNFIDTAQLYGTYQHVRRGLELSKKFDTIVATKTFAFEREEAIAAVEEARRELNRDCIDIFLLHQQESEHTIRGHRPALDYLLECRQKGIIRAVGLSTHHIAGVRAAIATEGIEIIHPIINSRGVGIIDGTAAEMLAAINDAAELGIGIYAMKSLGGGNLINETNDALDFALAQPSLHSIAIGMKTIEEVDWNIAKFNGETQPHLSNENRQLHIEEWCSRCGKCVPACQHGALTLTADGMKVDASKCVLCGYCGPHCEGFHIRVL